MNEPVAAITGATGGIGRWIALGLAEAGYRLFVIGRDTQRLKAAHDWIAGRVPRSRDRILTVQADLSSLAQTRDAGLRVMAQTDRLDLLINNAGLLSPRRVLTDEGFERTLAVNHLAPFVLTRTLLEALRGTRAARIVNVGSSTSDRARIDPDDLQDLQSVRRWRMVRAYATSKLALLMTSFALARTLPPPEVSVNVVHPGMVATGLVRNPGAVGLAWRLMAPFLLTEAQGAQTPLHAALSAACGEVSGQYWKRCRPAAANPLALDPALCARVLASTETLCAAWLPAR